VALSLQRTGYVAAQQERRAGALAAYRRGLDIMRRLTGLAPDHAAFKRDLAWFEARIAELADGAKPAPQPRSEHGVSPGLRRGAGSDPEARGKPDGGGWLGQWWKRRDRRRRNPLSLLCATAFTHLVARGRGCRLRRWM
jgi:hypothetical protein